MTKSKNNRNQQKAANKKARNHKFGFVRTLIVCIIIIAILIPVWNNAMAIIKRNEEIAVLTKEHNHRKINNDALEQKVEDPTDDEYIADIARDNGYRMPNEILFKFQ
jgi:cell division protein FtsB